MTDSEALENVNYSSPRKFCNKKLNTIEIMLDEQQVELNCLAQLKLGLEENLSTLRQLNLQIFEPTE